MLKKNKQAVLQKYSMFMNEFKAMALFDPEKLEWTEDTKELIDDLCFKWNAWCYDHGFYSHGKVLLAEIKVIEAMLNPENDQKEIDLREKFMREININTVGDVVIKNK